MRVRHFVLRIFSFILLWGTSFCEISLRSANLKPTSFRELEFVARVFRHKNFTSLREISLRRVFVARGMTVRGFHR